MWCSPAVGTCYVFLAETTSCFLPGWRMRGNEYASWVLLSHPLWRTAVKGFSLPTEGKQVGAVRVTAFICCAAWKPWWVRLHYGSVLIANIFVFFFFFSPKLPSHVLLCLFVFWLFFLILIPNSDGNAAAHHWNACMCIQQLGRNLWKRSLFSERAHCHVLDSLIYFKILYRVWFLRWSAKKVSVYACWACKPVSLH